MKTAKIRLLALLLVLAMLLCACGGDPEDVSGNVTPAPTSPAEEKPVSLGRMEGGIYTNTYAGFGCELDENWVFYTAEELQELPENTQELFAGTEMEEVANQYTQITDMMAENAADLTTVNVLYTQIPLQERLAYLMMSEEEGIDTTLAQKDAIIASYEQAGIADAVIEKVTVTFLGQEHVGLKTSATIQGIPYYTLQIMDYTLGAYGVAVTAASYMEDNTQAVLDLFYAVD